MSARSTPWLPDKEVGLITTGNPTAPTTDATSSGPAPAARGANAGWGTSRAPSRVRRASLSRAAATASGGLCRSPSCGRGLRGDEGAHVVDGDHGVDGEDSVVGDDHASGFGGVVQRDLERARPHELTQGVGLFGADDDVHVQGTGRVQEVPGPVRGRRDEEE